MKHYQGNRTSIKRKVKPERTKLASIIIQLPLIFLLLLVLYGSHDNLIINEFWSKYAIYLSLILTIIFGLVFFKIYVKNSFNEYLIENSWIGLLGTIGLVFLLTYLPVRGLVLLSIPVFISQHFGMDYSKQTILQKYDKGGKNCHYYVVNGTENKSKLCISIFQYDSFPSQPFKAKLIGKQSKLGFLVQSIEVEEP